jgi:hypothetical protein
LAVAFERLAISFKTGGRNTEAQQDFNKCASVAVSPNVWAPANLLPRDPVAYCSQEIKKAKPIDP